MEEYLTIAEVAERLKVKPKTIKNKMAAGIFQKDIHFFSPSGLGPRFKWTSVMKWLEQSEGQAELTTRTTQWRGDITHRKRGDLTSATDYLLEEHYLW